MNGPALFAVGILKLRIGLKLTNFNAEVVL